MPTSSAPITSFTESVRSGPIPSPGMRVTVCATRNPPSLSTADSIAARCEGSYSRLRTVPEARRLLLGAEENSGPDGGYDYQREQDNHHGGYEDHDRSLTRAGVVNFPDPHYGQVDTVQAGYPPENGYPAYEAGHGGVSAYPERTLEARVARAYDQHHEQVDYAGPDEQTDGGEDRGEDYGDEERAEP